MIDQQVMDEHFAISEKKARDGILDHRLDNLMLDGKSVEEAMRICNDADRAEWLDKETA